MASFGKNVAILNSNESPPATTWLPAPGSFFPTLTNLDRVSWRPAFRPSLCALCASLVHPSLPFVSFVVKPNLDPPWLALISLDQAEDDRTPTRFNPFSSSFILLPSSFPQAASGNTIAVCPKFQRTGNAPPV